MSTYFDLTGEHPAGAPVPPRVRGEYFRNWRARLTPEQLERFLWVFDRQAWPKHEHDLWRKCVPRVERDGEDVKTGPEEEHNSVLPLEEPPRGHLKEYL